MADIDFKVNVDIQTTGKDKIDSLEKQIEKLKNTSVKLNIDLSGNGADFTKYFSNIEKLAQSAGKSVGNSFQQGFKAVKFNGNSEALIKEFVKGEELLRTEAKKKAETYNTTPSIALKAMRSTIQEQKKIQNQQIKEAEKATNQLTKFETVKNKLQTLKSNSSKDILGVSGFEKVSGIIDKAEQSVQNFNTELAKGNNANFDNLTSDLKEINSLTKKATNEYEKLSSKASAIDQQNFINKLNKYAEANPHAVKAGQAQWNEMFNSAQSASMTAGQLKDAELNLKQFDNEMQAAGKTGKNFFDEFKRGFIKIGEFAYTYGAIQGVFNNISSSINELKDINTIVTEISKAADVPVKQLKDLETNSFSVASKYGQKASDYLLGVQEMTRAGYSDTNGMAELSTLAQSAGDMTAELANQYLIASDMAFGYGGNVEKLNSLLDSQNQITNRNAVNMTELANATKLVASQAAQSGVAEDEMTAALSTMIATTQQGGEIAARAFKGILMNLQQVTGELDDGEVIDETKLQKVEKRLTGVGVAMKEVKDGTVSLRDPMQVLEELAQVYNSLPDDSVEKAGIISDLGGKYRGNQLAALLSGWDKYTKILGDYQNAEGSAAQEAEKTANSWEGSLNRLSNSWTDLIANFADSSAITTGINFLNGIVSGVDTLTEKLGGIKTLISAISGRFLTKNGLGKRNADFYKVKQNNRRFINVERFAA